MAQNQTLITSLCDEINTLISETGMLELPMPGLVIFKHTDAHAKTTDVCDAGISIILQGKKRVTVEGKSYVQSPPNYLTLLTPMPVRFETLEGNTEQPLFGIGIYINKVKLANVLMRMQHANFNAPREQFRHHSVIYSSPLENSLLATLLRILQTCQHPLEMAVLGESLEDELYFRLLSEPANAPLIEFVHNSGKVHQISKAVEYIHQNIQHSTSIDALAKQVNMSSSGFQKRFKEVMHISPVQYAKQVKLGRARSLIMQGESVSSAFNSVGYNNAGQFSREYKRHFGVSPSEETKTLVAN